MEPAGGMRKWMMLLLVAVAHGCTKPEPPPVFETDTRFLPIVNVTIDLGDGSRDGHLVAASGQAIRQFGNDWIEGTRLGGVDFDAVNFTVLGPKSGDALVGRKLMHMSFRSGPFRQALTERKSVDDLMADALDGGTWSPSNLDVISDYCDDSNGGRFCARFNQ